MHGLGHAGMVDLGDAAAADLVVEEEAADDKAVAVAAAAAVRPNTGGLLAHTNRASLSNKGFYMAAPVASNNDRPSPHCAA